MSVNVYVRDGLLFEYSEKGELSQTCLLFGLVVSSHVDNSWQCLCAWCRSCGEKRLGFNVQRAVWEREDKEGAIDSRGCVEQVRQHHVRRYIRSRSAGKRRWKQRKRAQRCVAESPRVILAEQGDLPQKTVHLEWKQQEDVHFWYRSRA